MPASGAERRGLASSTAELAQRVAAVLGAGRRSAVWTDCGDELVVYAADVAVRAEPDAVVVDVPVATEQTGPVVLSIAILLDEDGHGVTDARPWGPHELADRWGPLLQDAVWSALAPRAAAAAAERGEA